jgi:Flp pilus assembly protein TadG
MRARSRRGIHAVEYALLMPVFLLLVVGCTEYSWLSYRHSALTSAADVGCRAGSLVDPGVGEADMDDVYSTAAEAMVDWYDQHGPGCAGTCSTSVAAVGSKPARSIRCIISIDYKPLTGLVPTPDTVTATAVLRLEYQRSSS